MLNSFASGSSNYLPVQEHVAFLFDLMELAFSIYDLIDVCIQVIQSGYCKKKNPVGLEVPTAVAAKSVYPLGCDAV
jgi:hypothetical protein